MAGMVGMPVPAAASAGTFRTTSRVNLRAEANTTSTAITVINSGTSVEVLDHNPAGWSTVTVSGSSGFIRSDFLKFPIASGSTATFKTTAGVNVRSSASTTASVVTTVVRNTSVEVSDHDPAGWSRVRVDGKSGFIRSDFLTRGGDGSAAGTEATGAGATSGSSSSSSSGSSSGSSTTLRTTGTVNIRSGPSSTNHSIVRTLVANTSVEVISTGHGADGDWSQVRHNNSNGYIRSDLLSATGSSQSRTLRTTGTVNMRSGPSRNNSIIRTLAPNTSVEVVSTGHGTNGAWSSVRHNNTNGFINSSLLSTVGATPSTLRTVTGGVRIRSGPSTSHRILQSLPANTQVQILGTQGSWYRVRHQSTEGYIRQDLLGTGIRSVEVVNWSTARTLLPRNRNIRIQDVRTGIAYNVRILSMGNHADVDPATQADTDAKLRSRNGVWSWAARPVWVTVGDRTFAAAINGMPHAGSGVSGNGLNGHFCLHFRDSLSHGTVSSAYITGMQNAITEAYNARPR